jgi:hypothetical protein
VIVKLKSLIYLVKIKINNLIYNIMEGGIIIGSVVYFVLFLIAGYLIMLYSTNGVEDQKLISEYRV